MGWCLLLLARGGVCDLVVGFCGGWFVGRALACVVCVIPVWALLWWLLASSGLCCLCGVFCCVDCWVLLLFDDCGSSIRCFVVWLWFNCVWFACVDVLDLLLALDVRCGLFWCVVFCCRLLTVWVLIVLL